MTLNSTLSSACHSERGEESALAFLKCRDDRSRFLLTRATNAINAVRRDRKALPERAGTPHRPAKAPRLSCTPPEHVPFLRAARKLRPFQKMHPTPSDLQSWSVRKHRALPPASPASRKSSPARRENPAGKDRVPALGKSPHSLYRYLPPSNKVSQAANTPRHTLRPSQSPAATDRASRRNRFSMPVHLPAAPGVSLASGFLSPHGRFSRKLQTLPAFSAPARMLLRIRTREKARKASPNPPPTLEAAVRASQSPAGSAPWFARDPRPAARAKESCPAAIVRAHSAAAARQLSSRRAARLRLRSGRNKFSPACSKQARSWDRAPVLSRFAPARCPNLPSPGKRRPAGYATQHRKAQARAPRANALSPHRMFAILFRGRRERRAVSRSADGPCGRAPALVPPHHSCARHDRPARVRFLRPDRAATSPAQHRSRQLPPPNFPRTLSRALASPVPALVAQALVRSPQNFPARGEECKKEIDETSAKYSIRCLPFRLTHAAPENYKQRLHSSSITLLLCQKDFNVHAA